MKYNNSLPPTSLRPGAESFIAGDGVLVPASNSNNSQCTTSLHLTLSMRIRMCLAANLSCRSVFVFACRLFMDWAPCRWVISAWRSLLSKVFLVEQLATLWVLHHTYFTCLPAVVVCGQIFPTWQHRNCPRCIGISCDQSKGIVCIWVWFEYSLRTQSQHADSFCVYLITLQDGR